MRHPCEDKTAHLKPPGAQRHRERLQRFGSWAYVLFYATFPVMHLLAHNSAYVQKNVALEFFWPLVISWVLFLVASVCFRSAQKGAIFTSTALLATFFIGSARFQLVRSVSGHTHVLLSLMIGVISFYIVAVVLRQKEKRWIGATIGLVAGIVLGEIVQRWTGFDGNLPLRIAWLAGALIPALALSTTSQPKIATTFLAWVGAWLFFFPIYLNVSHLVRTRPLAPMQSRSAPAGRVMDYNVYFIVLDGYGREDVLQEHFGMERDPLAVGLRERGFFVSNRSMANYTQTLQSVGATLNMDYLQNIVMTDPEDTSRVTLADLVRKNRVFEEFRSIGYDARAVLTHPNLLPLEASVFESLSHGLSAIERSLLERTPFFSGTERIGKSSAHSKRIQYVLNKLPRDRSGTDRPEFVLVHLVAPHPPFVLGEGSTVQNSNERISDGSHFFQEGGTYDQYVKGYRGQAQAVASEILRWLDGFSEEERRASIIVIQGDHGPKSRLDYESLAKSDLNECFPILFAVHGPDALKSNLYHSISPVNTFRLILGYLKQEDAVLLPDRNYYTTWSRPYDFVDVTHLGTDRLGAVQSQPP